MSKIKHLKLFISSYINGKKRYSSYEIERRRNTLFEKMIPLIKSLKYYHHIEKIQKVEDLPIINKAIMNHNFNDLNSVGLIWDECVKINKQAETTRDFSPTIGEYSIGSSSGTSGKPSVFATSKEEQIIWAGTILGKTINIFKPHKIALFLRSNNNLYENINIGWIKFKFFDLFADIDNSINELNIYQPKVLIAPAQVLKQIAQYQKDGKINIKVKKIYSAAEVLDEQTRQYIEDVFKIPVFQIYQATEGFLAISCDEGHLHLNEENLIIEKEWIDENRFIPIVTDLLRTTLPIIRYRLDDIIVTNHKKCNCGRDSLVIERIDGREGDTFKFENNKIIFSDVLLKLITSQISQKTEFNLVQEETYKFTLYLNNKDEADKIISSINTYLEKSIGVSKIEWNVEEYVVNYASKRRKITSKVK